MTDRALLKTLWPVLRRGAGEVQLGTEPEYAVVVEGLTPDEVAALEALDGTREVPPALRAGSGRDVLDLLVGHGLVVDAGDPVTLPPPVRALLAHDAQALLRTAATPVQGYAALARRGAAHVLVAGRGSLPAAVAAQLRRAGVGHVWQGAQATEDWLSPVGAAARAGCSPRVGGGEPAAEPALVVVLGLHALDAAADAPWRARGIPVLPVVLHGVEAVVGPVVGGTGPCLRCLDLARADLDPAWPALLGQLVGPAVGAGPDVSGETTLVAMAASMAAMVSLAVLDGQSLPVGRSLDVSLPWPRVRQRRWGVHPRCRCAADFDASARPADADDGPQARMAG